ncbi:MAG: G/U mismatch-specific DNA glycosylase [Acidimicrobiaceae bacterium]|nr:G/U mismatch-specific DNA glycosylase [Acidimicrobiaceae bacterium]MBO0747614.1 G/U mismatch-specific DNA glycosylase [Acidimicrobiaceae bacterium]
MATPGDRRSRPSTADLAAAAGRTIDDVIAPGLRVLFCGINPSLWSAAVNRHFARPGNRFWPALYNSGFVPVRLGPEQQDELPGFGLGITNLAARATARAAELTPDELRQGAGLLAEKVERYRPAWLAMVGITAYRAGFGRPAAVIGRQEERLGDTGLWVLPNPSGLNAHYTAASLATEFGALRRAVEEEAGARRAAGRGKGGRRRILGRRGVSTT